ncbi:hypothetical protein WJ41_35130 [Burkholderia ubonensis]|nr:hypothetical protein WJ41_35130 [Burkholderia ubonensis]
MSKILSADCLQFLQELAVATHCTETSLIEAGYDESIPEYIANGKTVKQVANVILSSRRRSARTAALH